MGKIQNGIYLDSEGKPAHRGIVEYDGKIYYAGKDGVIAKKNQKNYSPWHGKWIGSSWFILF